MGYCFKIYSFYESMESGISDDFFTFIGANSIFFLDLKKMTNKQHLSNATPAG